MNQERLGAIICCSFLFYCVDMKDSILSFFFFFLFRRKTRERMVTVMMESGTKKGNEWSGHVGMTLGGELGVYLMYDQDTDKFNNGIT